jgi:hypothetical protein
MKKLVTTILPFVLFTATGTNLAWAQGADPKTEDKIQSGYLIITPSGSNTAGLVAFETFGVRHGSDSNQAGVLPSDVTRSTMIYVSTSGRLSRNLGVAIANPDPKTPAKVNLALRDSAGKEIAVRQNLNVKPGNQISQMITELFANEPAVPEDFTGTLVITSDIPVASVGLRFRGINFSTLPVTMLAKGETVAANGSVGGPGAVILPQFASGGGWASEIVLANAGTDSLTVRVDFFAPDGGKMKVTLNGQTADSFTSLVVRPGGVLVLAPGNGPDDEPF